MSRPFEIDFPDDGHAKCVICGCTDDDCLQCIAATGHPCSWVDPVAMDLCSRCAINAARLLLAIDRLTGPGVRHDLRLRRALTEWHASIGEHHARGATEVEACENLEGYLLVVADRERMQMAASTLVANMDGLQRMGAADGRQVLASYPDLHGNWCVRFGSEMASAPTMAEAVADLVARITPPLPEGSLR